MYHVTAYTALAEPSRRQILDLLRVRERSVTELVDRVGLSQPGVSKHLKVLREAGLVGVARTASAASTGAPAPLAEVADWLEPYRRHWDARLDALEHHLEEHP